MTSVLRCCNSVLSGIANVGVSLDDLSSKVGIGASIAPTAILHPGVALGSGVTIDEYCIIGYPPKGSAPGELQTVIGDGVTIRSHAVIYAGVSIGSGSHVGHHVMIREHTGVGKNSSIGMNTLIEHHCDVGDNVRIQGQAGLAEYTRVEDDCWIGPRVVTANVYHPTCTRAKECLAGPVIRRGAIIGGHAFIAPNIEIGAGAFVGAGSVVVKAVDPQSTVFGVPARKTGNVNQMTCPYDMVSESPYAAKEPARRQIPLIDLSAQYQTLKQELRFAMDTVVFNNRFIQGKEVGEFETSFATFCGLRHVIGVSSGTSALELALRAMDIGPGDEVITSPHTFIATAEAIVAVGATPVFVDVDAERGLLDARLLPAAITDRTKVIMPVHLYGQLAPMQEITDLAGARGIRVLEDAAQAHGATLAGKGPGQWGDAATYSFYPGKNLGAFGDAGAIATDDDTIAQRTRLLRDHGRTEKYVSAVIGQGARLDTLQAAVLGVKLKRLAKWNEARRSIAAQYCAALDRLPIMRPNNGPGREDAYYVFTIRTDRRDQLKKFLADAGIATGIYYPVPLHMQPALAYLGYREGSFPHAEAWARECLALPMYPELDSATVDFIAGTVRKFFGG